MSAAKFTKGPWVYKWFGGPQIGGGKDGAVAICTLWGSWRSESASPQERANRDLICAAPDMLEALDYVWENVHLEGDVGRVVSAARKKARGRQVQS